jgi:hypothetical protein
MTDVISAGIVELDVGIKGQVWLNVDGVCKVRIGSVDRVVVRDQYWQTILVWNKEAGDVTISG